MKNKISIGFIGCGNMARAIISGLTDPASQQVLKANGDVFNIVAADCDEKNLMAVKHVCSVTTKNSDAAACDYVVLAVKPQCAEAALSGLSLSGKVVISIMAGIRIEKLKALTGSDRIVRVMPNLCARVGEAFNAYVPSGVSEEQKRVALEVLGSFGVCREVKETDMDAVTGITGSGPAFVFMTIKAFYDEARARGFDDATAREMAIQTVVGSALTAEKSDLTFDALIDSVCSKGGTTIEGVKHLREKDYENTVRGAIQRAIARSEEMSK